MCSRCAFYEHSHGSGWLQLPALQCLSWLLAPDLWSFASLSVCLPVCLCLPERLCVACLPTCQSAGPAASRQRSRTLLAVASSSGWLCVFGTAQHGSQPWSIVHSTGSLIAPGTHTQLAFSPDGTSLAVASPAVQLLGTDAVSLAAAGGQPGAVSLYHVADSSSGPAALLPPLLMEQQQLPELMLWHQWSLCSMPAGLAVLPSSGLQLLHGKQLHPSQVCVWQHELQQG